MKTILKVTPFALAIFALGAQAQAPEPRAIPAYKKELEVVGRLRIAGSELKGVVDHLVEGFRKLHSGAKVSTTFMTSSEGALGMMCAGVSEIAPMGDDAKISDQTPFYNSFGYTPTEVSIATGGYDQRGVLFAWAIIVNKANPISKLSTDQLDRIFGAERTGGWEIGESAGHNILYTAKYARGPETNIRKWGQLGLTGDWADKEIQTYGYIAPGFTIYFERKLLHWSDKWNPNYKEYVEAKEAPADASGHSVSSERLLEELSKDKYGIGWAAQMHIKDYPNVKQIALAVDEKGPYFPMTPETVANRSYPLVRDAYVYVNRTPGRPMDPKVKEFLRFVLSREGQEIIANTDMYYPLTAAALNEQLKRLE